MEVFFNSVLTKLGKTYKIVCLHPLHSSLPFFLFLTCAILVVSVPSNGCNEVDAGKGSKESVKAVGLATF